MHGAKQNERLRWPVSDDLDRTHSWGIAESGLIGRPCGRRTALVRRRVIPLIRVDQTISAVCGLSIGLGVTHEKVLWQTSVRIYRNVANSYRHQ